MTALVYVSQTPFQLANSCFVDGAITGTALSGNAPNPSGPPPGQTMLYDGAAVGCFHNASSGTSENATFGSSSISTTKANTAIIVTVMCGTDEDDIVTPTVSSITSTSGLVFTRINGVNFDNTARGQQDNIELWWALATSILTGEAITINLTAVADNVVWRAVAIYGVTAVDANGSASAANGTTAGTGPTVTISTTTATDVLIFSAGANTITSNDGVPSGFTQVGNGATTMNQGGSGLITMQMAYKIVTATQSSLVLAPLTHPTSGVCVAGSLSNA